MRVVFLGTPTFAVKVLDAIVRSPHDVVAVITQPDKVNARGKKITVGAVKAYALEHNLPIMQFANISREGEESIRALNPDIMVTCAYGQILRQNILDICPIFNVHASLLPKYRGSSPVQWALINGEEELGVTIMKTELGVDTGDMLLKKSVKLTDENSEEALLALSDIGAELIVKALDKAEKGDLKWEKQDETQATHCRMLTKADGEIDFNRTAQQVHNFVRGMTPWPTAYTHYNGGAIKFLKTEVVEYSGGKKSGEVVESDCKRGFIVKCGAGYVKVNKIQGENGKPMDTTAYLLGHKIPVGSVLGE
mgnify:CR=1 FL=1